MLVAAILVDAGSFNQTVLAHHVEDALIQHHAGGGALGVATLGSSGSDFGRSLLDDGSGEGSGGAAGFAKGGAKVTLEADGDATILTYTVDAQIGGKLAQLGGRLIDASAKKLAGDFFEKFGAVVAPPAEDAEPQKKKGLLGKLIG